MHPVIAMEHVGGPLHLQVLPAPAGQSRDYTLSTPVGRFVQVAARQGEQGPVYAQVYDVVDVHYSLRTVQQLDEFGRRRILWAGYVADDYAWEGGEVS